MRNLPFIVATAGHVDHGKSALVEYLTRQVTDRLPEEKRRGITIDLGFSQWSLVDPEQPQITYDLGMIDVPGHEDFVKNMVTGVSSIDCALLVIAADDGWMPQTEEHFQILHYLRVPHIIPIITKADRADADVALVESMIREELDETPYADAPIVATSALSGTGFDTLKSIVAHTLRAHTPHWDQSKPRLPIDRAFSIHGLGTVVTGTLSGAPLKMDQPVVIQPGGITTKIKSIQHHHATQGDVQPGMRVALNLSSVSIRKAHRFEPTKVGRGQVVTDPQLGRSTRCLDGTLERSGRSMHPDKTGSGPLRSGSRVWFHMGSDQILGRIEFPSSQPVVPGGQAAFRLTLERPCFVLEGDPFVIRDGSQQKTVGGGRVWDTDAGSRRFRSRDQQTFLQSMMASDASCGAYLRARLARDHGLHLETLQWLGIWTAKQLAREAALWVKEKHAIKQQGWMLDAAWWAQQVCEAFKDVQQHHQAHPEHPGHPIEPLRTRYLRCLPEASLWKALLESLMTQHQVEQSGDFLAHASHHVAMPDRLQPLADAISRQLKEKPLDPPYRRNLENSPDEGDAIRCLVRMGNLVELNKDMVMAREAFERLLQQTRRFLEQNGPSTVSQLKESLGISRRVAIPLFEKLDRDGMTRREGDLRSWRAS